MSEYKKYILEGIRCGMFDYGRGRLVITELLKDPSLTPEQHLFIDNYIRHFPVFDEQSTMNRLCHMVERELDGYACTIKKTKKFDYNILKSDAEYSRKDYNAIKKLYLQFNYDVRRLKQPQKHGNDSAADLSQDINILSENFIKKCTLTCPNQESLCNILVDICYSNNESKSFVWRICGSTILKHLLTQNNYQLNYLVKNDLGDVSYKGFRFSRQTRIIGKEVE